MPLSDAYFDLDKSDVRTDAQSALQKDAEWLKKWTSTRVNIEGHMRRTWKRRLQPRARFASRHRAQGPTWSTLALPRAAIYIVSKGKEAPACMDHNEACWQQNRRGHFVVVTAK